MTRHALPNALLALATALAALTADAAGTRTHVSNAGSDANTAFSCDFAHPCRTFAAALAQTTPGGEILAVDSGGFGKLVIDRSVAIIAAPGAFAGIGVGAGGNATGVEIATPGVDVVLRGLTLTGQGGDYGIHMTAGNSLTIEDCVVSGFSGAARHGARIAAAAGVRITRSVFRGNDYGVELNAGATAAIAESSFLGGSTVSIYVLGTTGTTTTAAVSDTLVADGSIGIGTYILPAGAAGKISITRSTIVNNSFIGVLSQSSAGTSEVTLGGSMVSGSSWGLRRIPGVGGAVLQTLGDNLVTENGSSNLVTSLPPG